MVVVGQGDEVGKQQVPLGAVLWMGDVEFAVNKVQDLDVGLDAAGVRRGDGLFMAVDCKAAEHEDDRANDYFLFHGFLFFVLRFSECAVCLILLCDRQGFLCRLGGRCRLV